VDVHDNPVARPLTYPGRLPASSGLLAGDRFLPLRPVPGEPVARWAAPGGRSLRRMLAELGASAMEERRPVVAVGSNAAPGQLYRKLAGPGGPAVVPLTAARVGGLAAGVSAHVSAHGYLPAAPIPARGPAELFVLWVDGDQLAALDLTEPNYHRRALPPSVYPVTLAGGLRAGACEVYVGRHGCLADHSGEPLRLTSQRELIRRVVGLSPGLARLCGDTPEEFVRRARDAGVREAAYALFRREGLARPTPLPV